MDRSAGGASLPLVASYSGEHVFFYGTLMTPFARRQRAGIEDKLRAMGRGSIEGALFDLGIYPAAVRSSEGLVWGDVYEMIEPEAVLAALDEIEGFRPEHLEASLYVREQAPVTLEDGRTELAWVYFYNAPLGRAPRIESGDYKRRLARAKGCLQLSGSAVLSSGSGGSIGAVASLSSGRCSSRV